jgi:GT2 family glycosyltransferase
MDEPLLSITTGTRNRPDSIARFVRSVLSHTRAPFELLIADASDRESPPELASLVAGDARLRVVREDPPLGPVRGSNALFRRARGRWVCFLNDDLEVVPGWDAAVLAAAERCPRADLLCLPVLERGDTSAKILLYQGLPYACMGALRRSAGEAVGWYDEGYAFYATDPDLAMRLLAAGRGLAPVLGTRVVHERVADAERASHREQLARDNVRLALRWNGHMRELRRRYRRSSYRHFRGLETTFSEVWNTEALEIPLAPAASRRRLRNPHQVDAPGWWIPGYWGARSR